MPGLKRLFGFSGFLARDAGAGTGRRDFFFEEEGEGAGFAFLGEDFLRGAMEKKTRKRKK